MQQEEDYFHLLMYLIKPLQYLYFQQIFPLEQLIQILVFDIHNELLLNLMHTKHEKII